MACSQNSPQLHGSKTMPILIKLGERETRFTNLKEASREIVARWIASKICTWLNRNISDFTICAEICEHWHTHLNTTDEAGHKLTDTQIIEAIWPTVVRMRESNRGL